MGYVVCCRYYINSCIEFFQFSWGNQERKTGNDNWENNIIFLIFNIVVRHDDDICCGLCNVLYAANYGMHSFNVVSFIHNAVTTATTTTTTMSVKQLYPVTWDVLMGQQLSTLLLRFMIFVLSVFISMLTKATGNDKKVFIRTLKTFKSVHQIVQYLFVFVK